MEEILQNVVDAVCVREPALGSEWHQLLDRSVPTSEDPEWRELVERLAQVAGEAGVAAEGLMDALAVQSDPRQLQAAIAAVVWPEAAAAVPDAAEATIDAEEDPSAWNAFLLANGPVWDGTDESWPGFVDWFVYHADEQGVGRSARTFCEYAVGSGAREVFAQYGVVLNLPAEADAATDAAATATVPSEVAEAVETFGPTLFEEFRASNPDLAGLTNEQLKGVLADVLQDEAVLAASAGE